MAFKALLVGINYTGTSSELRGCAQDVLNVKNMLKTDLKAKDSDMIIISDAIPGALAPSRINIVTQLKKLIADAKPGDTIYFHYSGHGTYSRDSKTDADVEEDGYDEAICPKTGGNIKDDELSNIVKANKVGVKFASVLDCCHSGTGFDLINNTTRSRALTQFGILSVLSSCLDAQTAADAYIDKKYQGALTAALLQTVKELKGFGKFLEQFFSNNRTKLEALQAKIRNYLAKGGYDQIPNISWDGVLPPLVTGFKLKQATGEHRYNLRNTAARQHHADRYENEAEIHGALEQIPSKRRRVGAHV